ncbi:MAG: hypothetical protein ACLPPF_20070 [Rhodomicrobium sp.]
MRLKSRQNLSILSWIGKKTATPKHAALAILLTSMAFCSTAGAQVFVSRYDVNLAGIHIGDAYLHSTLNAKTYKVAVSADVTVLLVNTRIQGEATGSRAGVKLTPEHFRLITSGGQDSAIDTNFAGLGAANAKTPPHLRGAIDPLTALLATSLKPASATAAPCNHVLPILMGRSRFDLSLRTNAEIQASRDPSIVSCIGIAAQQGPGASGQQRLVMEIVFRKLPKPSLWLVEQLSMPTENGTMTIERAQTAVSGS